MSSARVIERLSEYVGENVFIGASTMSKVELRRYVSGIDALMWGTDYPHPEARGQHQARLETDFQQIPIEDRLLLGLHAVKCYDLDERPSGDRRRGRSHARATQPGSGAAHRPQRHP